MLVPTRELAQQVARVAERFGDDFGVRSTCLFGGASKGPQMADLRRGNGLHILHKGLITIMYTH